MDNFWPHAKVKTKNITEERTQVHSSLSVGEKFPGGGTFRKGNWDYRSLRVSSVRLGTFSMVTIYCVDSKESLKSTELGRHMIRYGF